MNKKSLSMKNLKVSTKLIISHGVIVALSLITIIACIYGIVRMTNQIESMYEGPTTSLDYMGNIQYAAPDIQRIMIWNILQGTTSGTVDITELEQTLENDLALIQEALEIMDASLINEEARAYKAQIETSLANGTSYRKQIVTQISGGYYAQALDTYYIYREYINDIRTTATKMNTVIRSVGEESYNRAESIGLSLIVVAIVLTAIATGIAIFMMWYISRMIAAPVQQIDQAAAMLRKGDLTGSEIITYTANDELGNLAQSMREALPIISGYIDEISGILEVVSHGDLTQQTDGITDFLGQFSSIKHSIVQILGNFSSTMGNIQAAAEQVNTGSTQISDGAQQLSQGATQQAAAVEQLSATINDITKQVSNTAASAAEAMDVVRVTGEQVIICNRQMNEVTHAMVEISERSNEISKIIKTIEDIAFQTNILALNAAVEAARAGSAGKGFTVVADEVRNLATKSDQAAKATAELIGDTVSAVNRGTGVVKDAAAALRQVVEGTENVSGLVNSITEDAQSEATALNQVTEGIEQISRVVQSNSATAEESAAAGGELSNQAENLNRLIARFKLRSDNSAPVSDFHEHDSYDDSNSDSYRDSFDGSFGSFSKY